MDTVLLIEAFIYAVKMRGEELTCCDVVRVICWLLSIILHSIDIVKKGHAGALAESQLVFWSNLLQNVLDLSAVRLRRFKISNLRPKPKFKFESDTRESCIQIYRFHHPPVLSKLCLIGEL